jgi:hypothetical protein
MSADISCSNSTSALHWPPPIADGLPYAARTCLLGLCVVPESGLTSSPSRFGEMSSLIHRPVGAIASHCVPSNPDSGLASPNDIGACRGFLPRGLCDACPRAVITSWQTCARAQASHNP